MAVTDLRTKLMYEMWAPTKDEWVKAGGKPEVYDLLAADGSGTNQLSEFLRSMDAKLDELRGRPAVDVKALAQDVVAALPPAATVDVDALAGPLADALAQHLPSHITLTGTVA